MPNSVPNLFQNRTGSIPLLDLDNNFASLQSLTSNSGASKIGIYDVGNYFTSDDVEGALQEVSLSAANAYNRANHVGTQAFSSISNYATMPLDLAMFIPGTTTNSQIMSMLEFVDTVIFPVSLTGSAAKARVAPTGAVSLTITQNGTPVGSIDFASGNTVATFTFASPVTFIAGDYLSVENQATADTTLADIRITFKTTRG